MFYCIVIEFHPLDFQFAWEIEHHAVKLGRRSLYPSCSHCNNSIYLLRLELWFNDLHQIRTLTSKWMEEYNTKHPHSALNDMFSKEYNDRFGEEFFPETNIINENLLNLELS